MSRRNSLTYVALVGALALGGCATAAHGVADADKVHHVSVVEVVQHDAQAPSAFGEGLRLAVLEEAILYGGSGRALTLRIDLDRVHFKNPLKAIIVGDDNIAKGRVAVIDTSTGAQTGAFPVQVNAERGGLSGADVGTMILGALDPTGLVDLGSMAASAASANLNRSRTETGLRINFAREALRQTFGDAKAKAAHPKEK